MMVWVYYSSCILLLGAEFTHAYATREGRRVRLRAGAVWVKDPMDKLGQRARRAPRARLAAGDGRPHLDHGAMTVVTLGEGV
ncbi:MAG: hypothetical protein R3A52_10915 [Polyangiales bacterium]